MSSAPTEIASPTPPLPTAAHLSQRVRRGVVPAAGLGTRLLPSTLWRSKELMPLGLYPALSAALLEARAAGLDELVVVVAPGKDDLQRFLDPSSWGPGATSQAVAPLRALFDGLAVRVVEQPVPAGVLDAIWRGLPGGDEPCAILFPDLLHLPDQQALRTLLSAYAGCGQAVYGLYDAAAAPPGRHGPSLVVELEDDSPVRPGEPRRIRRLSPPAGAGTNAGAGRPGELRTTFGTVHTAAMTAVLERAARGPAGDLEDARLCDALNILAREGGLFGVLVPGEIVDLGHASGYLEAARRFASGEARLRGLP